jgi:hypothetical protein
MKPAEVRGQLVEALRLDLVGPDNGSDLEAEVLAQAPSRWYLSGFLVPLEADPAQKIDDTSQDEFDFADRHGFWGRFVKSLQNTAFRRFSVAFHGLGNGRRLC